MVCDGHGNCGMEIARTVVSLAHSIMIVIESLSNRQYRNPNWTRIFSKDLTEK